LLVERSAAPVRYLWHGLQMAAAYVGQMAPASRITMTALFQAAGEMRRVQRLAQWLALVRRQHPGYAQDSRGTWDPAARGEPLLKVLEQLLVKRDFGESFIALNLCVKPYVDQLFLVELPALARRQGDPMFAELLVSFADDAAWQRQWSAELLRHIAPSSRAAV